MPRNDYISLENLKRGIVLALIVALGYFIPNNFVFFPTHSVLLTRIDHMVALSPNWVWFYVSYYVILVTAYFHTTGHPAQKVYFSAMSLAAGVGFIVFTFFPTMIPRDLYPWNGAITYSSMLLEHIRGADYPVNCCPSMHVAMSFIAASCMSLCASKSFRTFVWVWFLAIVYSTMATKQHYFVDVVSGFALGATCVAIFLRYYEVVPDFVEALSNTHDPYRFAARARTSSSERRSRFRDVVSKLRRRG